MRGPGYVSNMADDKTLRGKLKTQWHEAPKDRVWAALITLALAGIGIHVGMCFIPEGTMKSVDHFTALIILGIGAATTLSVAADLAEKIFPKSSWGVVSKALLASAAAWTLALAIARYCALGEIPEL